MRINLLNCIVVFIFISVASTACIAQEGLERIIVEKYYVSDANDSLASGGPFLPAGSVTYRIYADMKPGYRLQAVYGVPGHELSIKTSSWFYNNETYGAVTANDVSRDNLNKGTAALDSWISVCAASSASRGVLKTADTDGAAFLSGDSVLQNNTPDIGYPVQERDGHLAATPIPIVSLFGLDTVQLLPLGKQNDRNYSTIITDNGSWASFGGAVGQDTTNCVLIAQLTTAGNLTFALNIQLGTPYGGVENYVAKQPVGEEKLLESLTYPLPHPVKKGQK